MVLWQPGEIPTERELAAMNDGNQETHPMRDSWLDILILPQGKVTFWVWGDSDLPDDLLDKLGESGLVLELKHISLCG
jgi:hypothetical protein